MDVQRRLSIQEQPSAGKDIAPETSLRSLPLPSSKGVRPPARPGYGAAGRKCILRANHFLVELSHKDLYHYDVNMTPEIKSKSKNRMIMLELVNTYGDSHLGKRLPVYDGRKSLYTAGALPFDSKEFSIELKDCFNNVKRPEEFHVTIRLAGRADVHLLTQFINGKQFEEPHEAIHALDVVLRETASLKYVTASRSFFSPHLGNPVPIGDGIECWRGFYQSLRPTHMGLSLNIDVSATSFYGSRLVSEFVMEHLNIRDPSFPLTDAQRIRVKKVLRGVRVEATHQPGGRRRYRLTSITTTPMNQLTFALESEPAGTRISVVRYFKERYGVSLKFINWPCLQAGSDSKPTYLPMEVCKIVEGQKYIKKLNDRQVTAMLRATCKRPQEREQSICHVAGLNSYVNDKFAKEFGLRVHNELTTLEGRVLDPPVLKYGHEKECKPSVGQWNMIDKRMVNGGTVKNWACLNLSRLQGRAVEDFCFGLAEMCQKLGICFEPRPLIDTLPARPEHLERALVDIQKRCAACLRSGGCLELLIVILPERSGFYGPIKKICETELGIVSQCCQPRNITRINPQYLENVSLKINVKVNGRNTVLLDAFSRRLQFVSDMPTIIFGADVTHPVAGEDSSPSIAAVVASMDWPYVTNYRALVSAQSHRQEMIKDLYTEAVKGHPGGLIRDHLLAFYRTTKAKPSRIIFYRDGVSEGQFNEVLLYEMDAIRKACASLENGYLPPVTFVVVQKRHHTRFFPQQHGNRQQTDRSGNILPGTVVDTKICHPTQFDFYLCSHAGIQGTSRPTHYHVLYDENRFSADALQILTNKLCYTYARCARSVSVVPPAYYAHLAAFRARYYLEGESDKDSSSAGSSSRARPTDPTVLPKIKDNVKEVMFYC